MKSQIISSFITILIINFALGQIQLKSAVSTAHGGWGGGLGKSFSPSHLSNFRVNTNHFSSSGGNLVYSVPKSTNPKFQVRSTYSGYVDLGSYSTIS